VCARANGLICGVVRAFAGIEFVGETVANAVGLTDSRYQWVIDSMTEEDWQVLIVGYCSTLR
jgi:hypothetical protein